MDDVDLLTESQIPPTPVKPRSVFFHVDLGSQADDFDPVGFRNGLQEALIQDPDLLALGRKVDRVDGHATFISAAVEGPVTLSPGVLYRVRLDLSPNGRIDRDLLDEIITDNVKAELAFS